MVECILSIKGVVLVVLGGGGVGCIAMSRDAGYTDYNSCPHNNKLQDRWYELNNKIHNRENTN